jgi:phosphinothricin acetyltransferase
MDPISVRAARVNDVAAMAEIYNHVVATSTAIYASQPSPTADRRDWFKARTESGLVLAAWRGRAVGYAFAEFRGVWPGYRTR